MAEEDQEYLKLPIEERCVHKLWKARKSGYEAAKTAFIQFDADDAQWRNYTPIIKKFVTDTNAIAQEQGLEAALMYCQNCDAAPRQAGDITSGLIDKCLGAPKAKTKDLAKDVALMLVEVEAQERVLEELLTKGLAHKTPKVVVGSLTTLTECLKQFGAKVIKVSPLLKATTPLLDHRDKTVREAGKNLIIESYRWVGAIMKQQLSSLKPIQLTELEAEFEKVAEAGKAKPERYLRSQMPSVGGGGDGDGSEGGEGGGEEGGGAGGDDEAADDPYDMLDPVDILSQLPKDFYEKVEQKKWTERKEALEALKPLSETPKIQPGDFGDLVRVLKKFIGKDTNVVLVAMGAQCLAGIATGLRQNFKPYAASCLSVILEKFKEKKVNVVNALVQAIDAIYPAMGIEAIQEDCLAALKHKTPTVVAQNAKFLGRCFLKCPPLLVQNKKILKGYASALVEALNHSDPGVREAALEALGVLFKFMGEPLMSSFCTDVDAIKMGKIKEYAEKAELQGKPASAMQAKPKPKPASAGPKVVKSGGAKAAGKPKAGSASKPASAKPKVDEDSAPPPAKKVEKKPLGKKPAAAPARKKAEEVDTSAVYTENNLKNQRFKDESKLKILKWNFATPRAEFVEQLKEQIETAGFNTTLMTQMFHSDFKQHLKAIETLRAHLPNDIPGLQSNLDLILKWMTLRFFETNPSVILKGLEYLLDVFSSLAEENYVLADLEVSSFVPYLINKIGDPKDQIRSFVKQIFKKLCLLYATSRLSAFLMEGIKAKNAKLRAEVLDELGTMVRDSGSSVLQPTPGACLKEIAKQIGDRDNGVRNGALNCITEVYFKDGEKIYKALGNLPEKDMAMLEERIKRQSKTRPPPGAAAAPPAAREPPQSAPAARQSPAQQMQQQAPAAQQPQMTNPLGRSGSATGIPPTTNIREALARSKMQRPRFGAPAGGFAGGQGGMAPAAADGQGMNGGGPPSTTFTRQSPSKGLARPISGAFTLDLDKIESQLNNRYQGGRPPGGRQLIDHNVDDILNDPPVRLPERATRNRFGMGSPGHNNHGGYSNGGGHNGGSASPPAYSNGGEEVNLTETPEAYELLDVILAQIFNQDAATCISSLIQLDELMRDEEKVALLGERVDQLLTAVYMQYRHVLNTKMTTDNYDGGEVMKIFQHLTMVVMSLYKRPELTVKASRSALHDLIHVIICILLDPAAMNSLPQGSQLIRALNVLTVKIIERSDHTAVTSAFFKLFKDTVGNQSLSEKYNELVMKCIWKIIRCIPQWMSKDEPFDIDLLLADLHDFLKSYPTSYWKSQDIPDTPMRTVKTVLHTMAKQCGDEILDHLTRISDPENSELVPYLKKVLSNGVGKENAANNNQNQSSSALLKKRLPKFTKSDHDALGEIFKKIGMKDQTKQGLMELHTFLKANPEANLEPFLAKSSQFFRDYIDRGLKNIEADLANGGSGSSAASSRLGEGSGDSGFAGSSDFGSASSAGGGAGGGSTDYGNYMERLKKLRERGGLEEQQNSAAAFRITSATSTASTVSSASSYRSEQQTYAATSSESSSTLTEATAINGSSSRGHAANVEDIRKRLERIKQSAF